MADQQDALGEYFGASTGDWPGEGVAGVESDWFEAGPWGLDEGPVLVADPMTYDGVRVEALRAGAYVVGVRGMDYAGHRRVSRLRLVADGVDPGTLARGEPLGEADVDMATLTLSDGGVLDRLVPDLDTPERERLSDYLSDYNFSGKLDILLGTHVIPLGKQTGGGAADNLPMVVVQPGLGDGGYPVYPLVDDAGTTRGVECVFLEPGKAIPSVPTIGG